MYYDYFFTFVNSSCPFSLVCLTQVLLQAIIEIGLMPRTGIFFTYFQGERLRDFPQALAGILDKDNVSYYDAVYDVRSGLYYLEPVPEERLLKVHSPDMVARVKLTGDYESAESVIGGIHRRPTRQAARPCRKDISRWPQTFRHFPACR